MGVAVGACRVWQWAPVEEELEPRQRGEKLWLEMHWEEKI